jgi:hypothetical protein
MHRLHTLGPLVCTTKLLPTTEGSAVDLHPALARVHLTRQLSSARTVLQGPLASPQVTLVVARHTPATHLSCGCQGRVAFQLGILVVGCADIQL